jgi:hypothetical protein
VIDVQKYHQEAGMLSAAYVARKAESANLDSTLAKRLMDKGNVYEFFRGSR